MPDALMARAALGFSTCSGFAEQWQTFPGDRRRSDSSSNAPGITGVTRRGLRDRAVLITPAGMRRLPPRRRFARKTSSGGDAFGEGQQHFCITASTQWDAAGSQGYKQVTAGWKIILMIITVQKY